MLGDNKSMFLNRAHQKSQRIQEAMEVIFNSSILAVHAREPSKICLLSTQVILL